MIADDRRTDLRVLVVGRPGVRSAAVAATARARLVGVAPNFDESWRDRADLVVVGGPIAGRPAEVRRALLADRPVLCAAPIAEDEDEARDLATLAEARGVRLATSSPWRFLPPVRDALALLSDGAIGRVEGLRVEADRDDRRALPPVFDLIRAFLGEIGSVHAQDVFALCRNRDRAVAELRWVDSAAPAFDVLGTEGYLHVQTGRWRLSGRLADGRRIRHRYALERAADRWSRWRRGAPLCLVREVEAIRAPRDGARGIATGWDGCRSIGMGAAIELSSRQDREVALRPLPVRTPAARKRTAARERD